MANPRARDFLSTPDEIDDLDFVAVLDDRFGLAVAFDDGQVVLDRDAAGIDAEPFEKLFDRHGVGHLGRLTVELDFHAGPHDSGGGESPLP
jgi:hypothetical protein